MQTRAQAVRSIWQPQRGPQELLLATSVADVLYGGARGGGKTDGALGAWLQHWSEYGGKAYGIFFRRRYKQLDRVIRRGKELFCNPLIGAKFISSKDRYCFVFPDGAELLMRHLETEESAMDYQGHEYNFMVFEELTQWPTPKLIDLMRAVLRDPVVKVRMIATANPGGPGHQWVKDRYITPAREQNGKRIAPHLIRTEVAGEIDESEAIFIPAKVWDNRKLLESQPEYVKALFRSGPEWLVRAWLNGDWDIIAGGYFEGIWRHEQHVVTPYDIPLSWPRFRAMDWGTAAPYAIGYFAQNPDTKKLTLYRELYGWSGIPNVGTKESALEVKARILEAEAAERKRGIEFRKNPADPSIWARLGHETSIYELFTKGRCQVDGKVTDEKVGWIKADASRGSRQRNAQLLIALLKHNLFEVFDTCTHFLRTVPTIPADEDNPEDVDTDAEDHMFDMWKYAGASRRRGWEVALSRPKLDRDENAWAQGSKKHSFILPRPVEEKKVANNG